MLLIKGYEHKNGVFEVDGKSISYDNVVLHIVNDDCLLDNFVGSSCEHIKVKVSDVPRIFSCKFEDLIRYIDVPVMFYYSFKNSKPELSKVSILDCEHDFKFNGDK